MSFQTTTPRTMTLDMEGTHQDPRFQPKHRRAPPPSQRLEQRQDVPPPPTGSSHIFSRHDFGHSSPPILNATDLNVVYMDRSFYRTSDIRAQKIGNETFMAFYSGPIVDGHGTGDGIVSDSHYNQAFFLQGQRARLAGKERSARVPVHG